ncbi:putative Sporulation domain-containing protein [uncultured Paludibacter sp.]|uniref:Putative Sporulation domain-containing protein n=1 Tax=uncultured Paludibacter sp. TaxID=497635 RepID=A0A653AG05_9BACT|nr:putative Sporulation domain-containing protein [uncultured Paludibacter sp.]
MEITWISTLKSLLLQSMEKIVRHIETLLRRHDYVILPDFGGFVIQHQPAKISEEQIAPPLAVVGFNPLMNTSDGLLAIEISRAENKSFREAIQLIDSEITQFKQQLKNKKTISCGSLGTLSLNPEGKIMFLPSPNGALLPANYGLSTLFYSQIAKEIEEKRRKTVTISIPSRNKIARYAAVGIIAVGLMFSAPKLNNVSNTTANFNPLEFFNTSEGVNNVSETTSVVENAITTNQQEILQQPEEKKYHVIVGCMPTQKMADDLCAYLKGQNYPNAYVVEPPIKTYRVAIESFSDKNEAIAYMENLRKTNPEFPDAWVLNY